MYLDYYHLTGVPFATTSHTGPVFLSAQHQAAIESVINGIHQQRGIIALIGEAGVGKTTLLLDALNRHQDSLKTLYIKQVARFAADSSSPKSFIRDIGQELGQDIKDGSFSEMAQNLQDHFIKANQDGKNAVIVIDNAHYLNFEVLQLLPQIINIFPYQQKFVQVILVGRPALKTQLSDPKLQDLQQHIGFISTLSCLKKKESRTYVRNKLHATTTQKKAIFSGRALNKIVKAARGVPRNLNILCTDALTSGFQNKQNPISGRIARQVVADFADRPTGHSVRLRWLSATGAIVAAGLVILFAIGKRPTIPTDSQAMSAIVQPDLQTSTRPDILTTNQMDQPIDIQSDISEPIQPSPVAVPVALPEKSTPRQVEPVESKLASALPLTTALPTAPPAPQPVVQPPVQVIQQAASLIQQAFPTGGDFELKVWADKGTDELYREKEKLLVHVLAESDAYLQVDYYQADGQVVHLLPNLLDSNQVAPGQIFTLGKPGNTFQFEITPPFGVEMLTVVASQEPFETHTGTPNAESATDYLETLAHRLESYKTQGKAAAAFLRIRTAKGFPTRLSRTDLP